MKPIELDPNAATFIDSLHVHVGVKKYTEKEMERMFSIPAEYIEVSFKIVDDKVCCPSDDVLDLDPEEVI